MKTQCRGVPVERRRQTTDVNPPDQALDFDGQKYRHASAHQKEWGAKLIAELNLKGCERILDLGCGDGALTAQLASLVPGGFVVGVDSSPSMIAAASEYSRPNLSFTLLDINRLEYEQEFDVVFSNSALHWVKDHRNLLARVLKALRAGGVLRFNFPGSGNCATFNRTVRQVMRRARYAASFHGFVWPWYMPRPEDYQRLASRVPFRELKVYGENADRFFPDAETMIRWIDQPCLPPFLSRLKPADREAFRTEVVARMVKATCGADGRCFETFRRVHIFARTCNRARI
jgi:trans-aconitate methyltransferase